MKRATYRSARAVALKVLSRYNPRQGDAAELLHLALSATDRSGQATDLVYGVIRNRTLLDTVLSQLAELKQRNVKPAAWNILRLGVYELVFATKTAEYAILNEAVNLAGSVGSQKSAGFVNAVLRRIQRHIVSRDADDQALKSNPRATLPRAEGGGCELAEALLPDPFADAEGYLSLAWSLPRRLVRDWIEVYGRDTAADICRASNRHPSVVLWPDTRRISAAELAEHLCAEGVSCRLRPESQAVQVRGSGPLSRLAAFDQGLFYVQDPAAQAIAAFLDPQPGDTLVDLCAAPGGKTIALALKMQDTGQILASDASLARLKRLEENVSRLGLSSVGSISKTDLPAAVRSLARCDAIILDVPCSNTGVLARRVEARRRLERPVPQTLLRSQQGLLEYAVTLLKPGTKLLYSTCSLQPVENTHQVSRFIERYPQFCLLKEQTMLPCTEKADQIDHDGGYMALLAVR